MRLVQLQPRFLRAGSFSSWYEAPTLAEATGVQFLCPKCLQANGMSGIGVHSIICWSKLRGTPDDLPPRPGRWALDGTSFDDLTLNGELGNSRSVLLTTGCRWHGFITNGEVHE